MVNDDERQRMWLWRGGCVPGALGVLEVVQLHAAGTVPPGVGLYRTRELATQAQWWSSNHPSRPVPTHLAPAATT